MLISAWLQQSKIRNLAERHLSTKFRLSWYIEHSGAVSDISQKKRQSISRLKDFLAFAYQQK
jgi:hypothetical protein